MSIEQVINKGGNFDAFVRSAMNLKFFKSKTMSELADVDRKLRN